MTHVTRDMTHVTPFVSTHLPLDPVVVDRYIADLNIEVASFDDDALLPCPLFVLASGVEGGAGMNAPLASPPPGPLSEEVGGRGWGAGGVRRKRENGEGVWER